MTFKTDEEVYHSTFGIGTVKEISSEDIIVVKFGPTIRTIKSCFLREVTENLRPPEKKYDSGWPEDSKKETEMLRMLRASGGGGVRNIEFVNNSKIGHRFSVTVQSLRDKGYLLETVKINHKTFKTVLIKEP